MGEAIKGEVLTRKELEEHKEELIQRQRQAFTQALRENYDKIELGRRVTLEDLRIESAGEEVENTIVDKSGLPFGAVDGIIEILSREILHKQLGIPLHKKPSGEIFQKAEDILHQHTDPEYLNFIVERKTEPQRLFNLRTSLDELSQTVEEMFLPLSLAAGQLNADVTILGVHPLFNNQIGREMITPHQRYIKLHELLDEYALPKEIRFRNGDSLEAKGLDWMGFTSLQLTIKVPLQAASYYHDAASIIGPLFLAVSASSPFIDGRLSAYDSTRAHLLPNITYGLPFEKGREGRWKTLDSLTTHRGLSKWADRKLYGMLRKEIGLQEGLARYCAEICAEEPVLVRKSRFNDHSMPIYPTSWPRVKLHWSHLDEQGIRLEVRYGEMPFLKDIPSFNLAYLAALQGVAEALLNGEIQPLQKKYVDWNRKSAATALPNNRKKMYWPLANGKAKKIPLPYALNQIGNFSAEALRREGHDREEIRYTLNSVLEKAGAVYTGNGSYQTKPKPHPAELQRRIALQIQPGIADGERMNSETLQAVLNPFIIPHECKTKKERIFIHPNIASLESRGSELY